jgi:hypothetical protein
MGALSGARPRIVAALTIDGPLLIGYLSIGKVSYLRKEGCMSISAVARDHVIEPPARRRVGPEIAGTIDEHFRGPNRQATRPPL